MKTIIFNELKCNQENKKLGHLLKSCKNDEELFSASLIKICFSVGSENVSFRFILHLISFPVYAN